MNTKLHFKKLSIFIILALFANSLLSSALFTTFGYKSTIERRSVTLRRLNHYIAKVKRYNVIYRKRYAKIHARNDAKSISQKKYYRSKISSLKNKLSKTKRYRINFKLLLRRYALYSHKYGSKYSKTRYYKKRLIRSRRIIMALISPRKHSSMSDKLGFAVGNNMVWLNDAELASQLNGMAALGVKWIRHDMQWNAVQPSNSTSYSWSSYDRLITEAGKRNIKILPILAYTPGWARRTDASSSMFSAPANPDQFATFAKAAVQRYAPMGIRAWEIWNEPNLTGFWRPAPNIAAYTNLLKKTYERIKQADPSATVISGGLSPAVTSGGNIAPRDFVSGMYANGAKNYFDVLGHHPYSYPALSSSYYEWSAWSQMSQTNPSIRSIMTNHGDNAKPIWSTEFGVPTAGRGDVSESLQAQAIEAAVGQMQDKPWLQKLFIYSYKDIGTSTSTVENFFGVVRYNGTYKPGYYSVKNTLSK